MAEFLEASMDPGQESEAVGNYLRKHPDTAAATSVCNISAGLLSAKAESGKNDLVITGYDLDPQAPSPRSRTADRPSPSTSSSSGAVTCRSCC